MDRTCFNEIIALLTPYMDVPETRQAIMQTAWYGSPLLHQVAWTGSAQTFTVLAVRKAIDFGQIERDVPALLALLEGLRAQVGYEVQQQIDAILARCVARPAADSAEATPDLPPAQTTTAAQHLFISYASADRAAFVDRLAKDLHGAGYAIWVDNLGPQYNGITAGQAWQQALADALHQAQVVIFVITADSLRSKWCRAELKRAAAQKTPIIPVLARPLKPEDQPLMAQIRVGSHPLGAIQYRDFVGLGYDAALSTLLDDVSKHLA